MKGNEGKFHVLLSTNETLQMKIGVALINSSKCDKLLAVKIDNKLTLKSTLEVYAKKQGRN